MEYVDGCALRVGNEHKRRFKNEAVVKLFGFVGGLKVECLQTGPCLWVP